MRAGSKALPLVARLLGGSWGVISGVIRKVTIVITHIRGLITPLIPTHEPPSVRCLWTPIFVELAKLAGLCHRPTGGPAQHLPFPGLLTR